MQIRTRGCFTVYCIVRVMRYWHCTVLLRFLCVLNVLKCIVAPYPNAPGCIPRAVADAIITDNRNHVRTVKSCTRTPVVRSPFMMSSFVFVLVFCPVVQSSFIYGLVGSRVSRRGGYVGT